MHFTWALLIALNSRSWLRWPLSVYAGLIGISTIVLGQHYVVDLIAALPYTAAVQLLAKAHRFPAASFSPSGCEIQPEIVSQCSQ